MAWNHWFNQPSSVSTYPVRLIVDPTNHCNLSCPLCPTGQGRTDRPRGLMQMSHYEALLKETGPFLFDIDFYCWGEPLLHPQFAEMVGKAHRLGIATSVSSHFNHLTPEMAHNIVLSGLQQCVVSLDGASQETYATYRKGGRFEKVLKNVALINEAKRIYGVKTPHMVWQFIAMKHNSHEIAQALKCYRAWGFNSIEIKPVRCDMADETLKTDAEKTVSASSWMASEKHLQRYHTGLKKRTHTPSRCLFLWMQAVVHPNGNVSPCCANYHPQHDVGNAFETPFKTVWNNKAYQTLRTQVRSGEQEPSNNPCTSCVRHGFLEY